MDLKLDTGVNTENRIADIERQLEIVSREWMQSETRRETAVLDLVHLLNYLHFDTSQILAAYNRGEYDHVRDLVEEAVHSFEMEIAIRGRPSITGLVDKGTGMPRVRDRRSRSPKKLHISVDDSRPIRLDRPRGINTSVAKKRGPHVRKNNIEKSMEEFIPSKRSGRFT